MLFSLFLGTGDVLSCSAFYFGIFRSYKNIFGRTYFCILTCSYCYLVFWLSLVTNKGKEGFVI
jgi:hypothetical protein